MGGDPRASRCANDPDMSLLDRLRSWFWRSRFEHWDTAVLDGEAKSIQPDLSPLVGKTESHVKETLGDPTSIEKPSMQSFDLNGNIKFEADHGLIYDGILPHVRVIIYISDGTVHTFSLAPKLKRCPPNARQAAGTYYAPS